VTIIKNGLEVRKLELPKVKGVKHSNKQTSNTTKADSQTPKTIVKNRLEVTKLEFSKLKGVKNSNKQTIKHYKS